MPGPLSGVRILDFTAMIAGPMATMILADQGADVIKVEPPGGDRLRGFSTPRGMSGIFLSANRNKRSLAVDLGKPEGVDLIRRLLEDVDVLTQNFRPGAMERMGLGEPEVRRIRGDLVYVSISGFGETGPFSKQRAYDPVIQALSGLADIQSDPESGRPRMVRTIIPDKTTALTAAQAITAGLFARERTGEGQHVRLSMLDAMVAYLWPEGMADFNFVGKERDPSANQVAHDMIYETQDGYVTAAVFSDSEWEGLCRALERPDWLEIDEFKSLAGRFKHREKRIEMTAQEFLKWRTDEIASRMARCDVPGAPVIRRRDILTHPQVLENALIEEHEDPSLGRVRQPRPAARFEKTPSAIRELAPRLGQHNEEILSELNISGAEQARLNAAGILAKEPAHG